MRIGAPGSFVYDKSSRIEEARMYNKIGLEEHFGIPETLGGTSIYFNTGSANLRETRLLDMIDMRVEQMDEHGMDMMIMSLTSPACQEIYDAQKSYEVAHRANEHLAESIARCPDRFRGFAALPLQDTDLAIKELEHCVKDLGFVGVMVNGYSQIGSEQDYYYLDHERFRPFWAAMEELDCPLYLHPREPMPENAHTLDGHFWIHGAAWAFGVETATHALRLMCSGLFDEHPKLRVVLGHLGEGLPFLIWRVQHHLDKRRRGITIQRPVTDYFQENFWVTTSGAFYLPAMLCTMNSIGTDHIMFATDYPYEEIPEACEWFDGLQISEADKRKIGRDNANAFFKLGL